MVMLKCQNLTPQLPQTPFCFLSSTAILNKSASYQLKSCGRCSWYRPFPNHSTQYSRLSFTSFVDSLVCTGSNQEAHKAGVLVMTDSASTQNTSIITGELDHIAMRCKGPAMELARWYTDTVGFEAIHLEEYENGTANFPSVRVNAGTILDFFEPESDTSSSAVSSGSHICFSFSRDSFDILTTRLEERGVVLTEKKKRSGARGNGWSVYTVDPEGNNLEFRYYD